MSFRFLRPGLLLPVLLTIGASLAFASGEAGSAGFVPPVWTIMPFIGMLLSIALFPLFAPHFWEHNFGKISAVWLVLSFLLMYVSSAGEPGFLMAYGAHIFSSYEEYLSFIILLGSLFVISGGIYISGDVRCTPVINTLIILIGTLLASVIGTTGAAMLLIRPILRANKERRYQAHVVLFFIFLVCNIGGALTPIGDPPLFLGFLQGIPFEWTFVLTPMWAFTVLIVLGAFYGMDVFLSRREDPAVYARHENPAPVRIEGAFNFVLLLGVVGSVIMSGVLHFETVLHFGMYGELRIPNLLRDGIMVALAVISLRTTPNPVRTANHFNYEPILEVAYLFVGIFTTMIPALMLLNARGGELGLNSPAKFFWLTGLLSSFLDNAPTYLTFLATAMGALGLEHAIQMTAPGEPEHILMAISAGAVFMGANTYIGNGPNFMVKAIAEGQGIRMPSFFGYLLYSVIILFPVFVLVTIIFF